MHPVTPVKTYVLIWAALTVLTFTTWAVAYVDMGPFNIVVALAIAFIKMSLVVLFFMHVKEDSPLTKVFVGAGLFWMVILLVLTLGDYFTRYWNGGRV